MAYYILCIIIWPICLFLDLFLKIKRPFEKNNSIRILNYHSISSNIKDESFSYVSVSLKVFSAQMKFLYDNNFNIIDLDDFLEIKKNKQQIPPKMIILTFDDGYANNYINAFPIISKYSFKAVISVITEYIDKNIPFPWINQFLLEDGDDKKLILPLSKKQLKTMNDYGISIASHTRSHRSLSRLDKQDVMKEIMESKKNLEDILGKKVKYFTYPYGSWGDYDKEDKRIVKSAGYEAALSTKVGTNNIESDIYELRRIPIYNIDGISNFKRKVNGTYDFTGFFQLISFKLKKIINQ